MVRMGWEMPSGREGTNTKCLQFPGESSDLGGTSQKEAFPPSHLKKKKKPIKKRSYFRCRCLFFRECPSRLRTQELVLTWSSQRDQELREFSHLNMSYHTALSGSGFTVISTSSTASRDFCLKSKQVNMFGSLREV